MSDTAGVGPVDMTALHSRAAEVAERVIALNPGMGFALADIIDDERDLVAALENPVAAHMLVTGTLEGVVKALTHTPDVLTVIRELDPMDPPGGDVTPDDMETAYARIETALLDRRQPHATAAGRGDTVAFDVSADDPVAAARQIIALIAAGNDIATSRP
jgi:hypothetical protein